MDVGRSFTFVFDEEDWWKKIILGGLLSLIPVVGQFYLVGYAIEVLKNVIDGRELPLPEVVDDFGGKLLKGLLATVITFLYMLPMILIAVCPMIGISALADSSLGSDEGETVMTVVSICMGCLMTLWGILIGLIEPFAWSRYADTGKFGEAFKFGDILTMLKDNIGPAFVVILVNILAGLAAGLAGSILCGIGLFLTVFYAQLVKVYLYGTLYRQARSSVL